LLPANNEGNNRETHDELKQTGFLHSNTSS
jgi:hypothetical protein